jgi:hypothetical protein
LNINSTFGLTFVQRVKNLTFNQKAGFMAVIGDGAMIKKVAINGDPTG